MHRIAHGKPGRDEIVTELAAVEAGRRVGDDAVSHEVEERGIALRQRQCDADQPESGHGGKADRHRLPSP
jgi:hypothetical protein